MIDYTNTVVHVWDFMSLFIAIMWVFLWVWWARRGFALPDRVMGR